jgi:hypothetical protein
VNEAQVLSGSRPVSRLFGFLPSPSIPDIYNSLDDRCLTLEPRSQGADIGRVHGVVVRDLKTKKFMNRKFWNRRFPP